MCCITQSDTFNYRLFRLVERLLKYMAFFCEVVMTLHVAALLMGRMLWVTEMFAGFSVCGFVALYIASYLLKFCWRYRACLIHSFMVQILIIVQRHIGLGDMLTPLRWVMLLSGLYIILSVIINELRTWIHDENR